jgi:hypothetical protein
MPDCPWLISLQFLAPQRGSILSAQGGAARRTPDSQKRGASIPDRFTAISSAGEPSKPRLRWLIVFSGLKTTL